MRKFFAALSVLVLFGLAGCAQEKVQVESYLNELHAAEERMKQNTEAMQQSMAGIQPGADGSFDAEEAKGHIERFEAQMKEEKAKVEALSVPEKAKELHQAFVAQYDVALEVLEKMPIMLDLAKDMSESAQKLESAPDEALAEMKEIEEKLMESQGELQELAEKGQKYEEEVKAEKAKLREEFDLEEPTSTSDGAGTQTQEHQQAEPVEAEGTSEEQQSEEAGQTEAE